MTALQLGLIFLPSASPDSLPGLCRDAEDAGLDTVWVWEDCFKHGGIASAAVALSCTSRISVGIGLLPTPLRNVAVTAMEVSTLAGIHPGRLIAGIGHGVQPWMEQVGARVASPLTLLREYATALRRLLAGEEVSVQGRYVRLDTIRLGWPPDPAPPIMIGATGDRSLALAGELGDGLLLAGDESAEEITHALSASGLTGTGRPVATSQIVATGAEADGRVRRELARWRESHSGPVNAGDAATIAASWNALIAAGVTSIAVHPTLDEPDVAGLARFIAHEVRPLLVDPAPAHG